MVAGEQIVEAIHQHNEVGLQIQDLMEQATEADTGSGSRHASIERSDGNLQPTLQLPTDQIWEGLLQRMSVVLGRRAADAGVVLGRHADIGPKPQAEVAGDRRRRRFFQCQCQKQSRRDNQGTNTAPLGTEIHCVSPLLA